LCGCVECVGLLLLFGHFVLGDHAFAVLRQRFFGRFWGGVEAVISGGVFLVTSLATRGLCFFAFDSALSVCSSSNCNVRFFIDLVWISWPNTLLCTYNWRFSPPLFYNALGDGDVSDQVVTPLRQSPLVRSL